MESLERVAERFDNCHPNGSKGHVADEDSDDDLQAEAIEARLDGCETRVHLGEARVHLGIHGGEARVYVGLAGFKAGIQYGNRYQLLVGKGHINRLGDSECLLAGEFCFPRE